jgi:hypothetical protein
LLRDLLDAALARLCTQTRLYVLATTAMIGAMEGELGAAAAGFEAALAIVALDPLELDAKAHFAELVCALAERELATNPGDLCRSLLHRACAAAERMRRPSLIVTTHALLARAESSRGDPGAARAHLEAARRALTPSVPVVRASRSIGSGSRACSGVRPEWVSAPGARVQCQCLIGWGGTVGLFDKPRGPTAS